MRPHVLALPALLAPFAAPAAAQCGTTLEYFDQSIAPVFEPRVAAFAPFDRDGTGPFPPVLAIVGSFFDLNGQSIGDLAAYDPQTDSFSQLAEPSGNSIFDIATSEDGRLAVVYQENFSDFGILRWGGSRWTTIATVTGTSFGGGGISDILFLPDGDLLAGGAFSTIGGVAAEKVARWDGTTWSPMGAGLLGSIDTLVIDPSGDLLAGTAGLSGGPAVEGVARFDGTSWQPYLTGTLGVALHVNDFAFLSDGRIAATGLFEFPNGVLSSVGIWDGADWNLVGAPLPPLSGSFPSAFAIAELPDGDLAVGGNFSSIAGIPAGGLARWDGSAWSALLSSPFSASVSDLTFGPNGDLWVGGKVFINSSIGGGFGRLIADCKAEVTNYGSGGSGSAGSLELTASGLPWLGTTFQAELGGLSAGAIALSLLGFQPDAVPLAALTPEGTADSTLLLVPDFAFFSALSVSAGTAEWSLPLPGNPSLVGLSIYLQGLAAEVETDGSLLLATSNGLDLLVGQF